MANKDSFSYSGFDFSDDLNMNYDDPMMGGPDQTQKRKPIADFTSGAYDGVKSSLTDGSAIKTAIKRSLPTPFTDVWDAYDDTASTVGGLYDHAEKELGGYVSEITKKIDSVVPERLTTIKKITSSLKEKFEKPSYSSSQQSEDEQIANIIGQTFTGMAEIQQQQQEVAAKEELANDARFEKNDQVRHLQMSQFLSRIDANIQKDVRFKELVGQPYQKKSLELNVRQYLTQQKILKELRDTRLEQSAMLKGIGKNTGLPDAVKLTLGENFKESMKRRTIGSIQDRIFGENSLFKTALNRLNSDITSGINSARTAMMMATMGVETAVDTAKDMAESNANIFDMLGNEAGKWGGGFVRDKLLKKGLDKAQENEELMRKGYKAANYVNDPRAALEDVRNSERFQKLKEKDTWYGRSAEKALDYATGLFSPQKGDTSVEGKNGLGGDTTFTGYSRRTDNIVTKAIPNYLARILQQVSLTNTPKKKVPLFVFDPFTGELRESKALTADIGSRLKDEYSSSTMEYQIEKLSKAIGELAGNTEDGKSTTSIAHKLTTDFDKALTGENIRSSSVYENASKKEKAILEALSKRIESDSLDGDKSLYELRNSVQDVRKNTTSLGASIQKMVGEGLGPQLLELGVVTQDKNGKMSLNMKEISKLQKGVSDKKIRSQTSDINKKENIKKYNPKQSLYAIRNTPVSKWNYRGDDFKKPMLGPMAQDVKKNLGDEAAPGGKTLDLVNMNGSLMAAVQQLADDQDAIKKHFTGKKDKNTFSSTGQRSLLELRAIRGSIDNMHISLKEKLMLGLPSFNTDMNAEKMKEILSSFGNSLGGMGSDLKNKASSTIEGMVDPIIKTGNAYFDTIQSVVLTTMDKGFKGINQAYQTGKGGAKSIADFVGGVLPEKETVQKEIKHLLGVSYEGLTKAVNKVTETVFTTIPNKITELADGISKTYLNLKTRVKTAVNGPRDIFLKGQSTPVLLATKMRAGFYYNAVNGGRIDNIDDLLRANADIMDGSTKEIALRWSDTAGGMTDIDGNELKTVRSHLTGLGIGLVKSGFKLAGNAIASTKDWWSGESKLFSSIKGIGNSITKSFSNLGGMSLTDARQLGLLAQIRDLLAWGKPQKVVRKVYGRNLKDVKTIDGKDFLAGLFGDKFKDLFEQKENGTGTESTSIAEKIKSAVGAGSPSEATGDGRTKPVDIETVLKNITRSVDKWKDDPRGRISEWYKRQTSAIEGTDDFVGPINPNSNRSGFGKAISSLKRKITSPDENSYLTKIKNRFKLKTEESADEESEVKASRFSELVKKVSNRIGSVGKKNLESDSEKPKGYTERMLDRVRAESGSREEDKEDGIAKILKNFVGELKRVFGTSKRKNNTNDTESSDGDGGGNDGGYSGDQNNHRRRPNVRRRNRRRGGSGGGAPPPPPGGSGGGAPPPPPGGDDSPPIPEDDFTGPPLPGGRRTHGRGFRGLLSRGRLASRNLIGKGLEIGKSVLGGATGLLGGMFGGKAVERETSNDTDPIYASSGPSVEVRGKKDGTAKNDSDGDGFRDGSHVELGRKQQEENKARLDTERQKADASRQEAKEESFRYKGENAIDSMLGKFGGIMDTLKGMAGNLLGAASDFFSKKNLGKLLKGGKNLGKSVWKHGKNFIKNPIKSMTAIGKPIAAALRAGNIASKVGTVARIIQVGALASGTTMGALAGSAIAVGGAAVSILTSPFVLGALAVGAVGYGAYKLYKRVTRNNLDDFEKFRALQYGLTTESDELFRVLELEAYLEKDNLIYRGSSATLNIKTVKQEKLLEIFDIEQKNEKRVLAFTRWFGSRFLPFFLRHAGTLNGIDNKKKLKDLKDLNKEQLHQYLEKAVYLDGPYNESETPFVKEEALPNTKSDVQKLFEILKTKKTKDVKKDTKHLMSGSQILKANADTVKRKKLEEDEKQQKLFEKEVTKVPQAQSVKRNIATGGTDVIDKVKQQSPNAVGEDGGKAPPEGNVRDTTKVSGVTDGIGGGVGTPAASGSLYAPSEGLNFLALGKDAKLKGLHPLIYNNLLSMATEYGKVTGKKIQVNEGFRTYDDQMRLYKQYPGKAAKPGNSLHELGLAVDISTVHANALEKAGLLAKYGFTRPVGGETWHLEPAGIQQSIARAKSDPEWTTAQIKQSPGRGGGGYGSVQGSPMGKRNAIMAAGIWTSKLSTKVPEVGSEHPENEKDKIKNGVGGEVIGGKTIDFKKTPAPTAPVTNQQVTPLETPTNPLGSPSKPAGVGGGFMNAVANTSAPMSGVVPPKNPLGSPATYPEASNDSLYKNSPGKPQKASVEKTKAEISKAATEAGVEPKTMLLFAAAESSMGQKTSTSRSTAKGPMQFVDKTWAEQLGKHAAKYGLSKTTSPEDVRASTILAAEYMKSNSGAYSKVTSSPDIYHRYMPHLLGKKGATKFFNLKDEDVPATHMPEQAKKNKEHFFEPNGTPFTKTQVRNSIYKKFNKLAKDFGIEGNFNTTEASKPANDKTAGGGMGSTSVGDVVTPKPPSIEKPMGSTTVGGSPLISTTTPEKPMGSTTVGSPSAPIAAVENAVPTTTQKVTSTGGLDNSVTSYSEPKPEPKTSMPSDFLSSVKKRDDSVTADKSITSGVAPLLERSLEIETQIHSTLKDQMLPLMASINDTLLKMYGEGSAVKGQPSPQPQAAPQQPQRPQGGAQKMTEASKSVLSRDRRYG